jgi:hypothetical protein
MASYNAATMPTNQAKTAGGCLALFALPFVAGGGFFAIVSYRSLNDPTFKNPWVGVGVGSGLFLLGCLIVAAGIAGMQKARQLKAVQEANPGQPWLWRKDWAQGRALGGTRGSAISTWVFALLWTGGSSLPVYFFFQNARPSRNQLAPLFVGLFPLIGICLLIWASLQTLRLLRFGKTFVLLQTLPAVLGKNLKGTIDVRLPYPLPHGINLALTCVNRVTSGTGNNRSTVEYIRWQDKKNLGAEQIMGGPVGSTIPIDFGVPRNLQSSDHSNASNEILWLLRAEADVPGVDFDETYEVPVFQTADSPTMDSWQANEEVAERAHPPAAPIRPTVVVSPAPEGGTQFYYPAGRNVSAAFGVTLFAFLFCGAEAIIFYLHAPFFFAVIFGLFDLLLVIIALNLWFGTARIVANGNSLALRTNTFGWRGSKQWSASEIRSLHPKITMQSGGGRGVAYYTVTLTDRNLREFSVGNAIRDHNEAQWICDQIEQIVGVNAKTASA